KVKVPRPLTHDLFKEVLDNLECRMKRVEIFALQDNTFYARMILENNGRNSEIDARPSDAIALALRCSAPIFVAPEVMDTAGVVLAEPVEGALGQGAHEHPQTSRIEDVKQQIARAVEEERYEDAARLRDELKKLTNTN
ncbi:MAG: bifunctional nuclease domain-containing protein, partial [Kiritimatiellia bacterium]